MDSGGALNNCGFKGLIAEYSVFKGLLKAGYVFTGSFSGTVRDLAARPKQPHY